MTSIIHNVHCKSERFHKSYQKHKNIHLLSGKNNLFPPRAYNPFLSNFIICHSVKVHSIKRRKMCAISDDFPFKYFNIFFKLLLSVFFCCSNFTQLLWSDSFNRLYYVNYIKSHMHVLGTNGVEIVCYHRKRVKIKKENKKI